MMGHLSSEQLAEFMAGQPSAQVARQVAQHVQDCAACRAELANFREALGEFRGAVRAWSEDGAGAVLAMPGVAKETRAWSASRQLACALLLAAVWVIASLVAPRHARQSAPQANDAVLLNQVDSQVSRTVPSSMEPLMKLVVQE